MNHAAAMTGTGERTYREWEEGGMYEEKKKENVCQYDILKVLFNQNVIANIYEKLRLCKY